MHPLINSHLQKKARLYWRAKDRLTVVSLLISALYFSGFFFSELSSKVSSCASRYPLPLALFFYLLSFVPLGIALFPLSFVKNYWIEKRFGLSSQSRREWFFDQVKALALEVLLGYPLLLLLFFLFIRAPNTWWLFSTGGLYLVQLIILIIFPVLILPIFFKQHPIQDQELKEEIGKLFQRAGLKVKGVYSFDLSSRTKKENAALTGLWKTRRLLLADTLLKNRSREQVLVVAAHELGHHLRKHIAKLALVGFGASFALFFLVHRIMGVFPGFPQDLKTSLSLFPLFVLVTSGISVPIGILTNAYSRIKEREADRVAIELTGNPEAFIAMMAELANTNLAIAYPRRYRVILFYTHPPIGERIEMVVSEFKKGVSNA